MSQDRIKLFVDFDGVIVNTIKRICQLYDEDYCEYERYKHVDWSEINSWEFNELEAAKPEFIDHYFNQPRFFNKLEWMPWAKEMLTKLNEFCDITIVTCGYSPNLKLKSKWIKEHLPFCDFQGVNFKTNYDKKDVNMKGGIFIDDSYSNLSTSNADINICFGDIYPWNEKWEGTRCFNWHDVWKIFKDNKEV